MATKKTGTDRSSRTKAASKKAASKEVASKKAASKKAPPKRQPLTDAEMQEIVELLEELGIPAGVRPESETEYRRVMAYHEAGHAVVGHVLGRTLQLVSAMQHCAFDLVLNPSTPDVENSIKIGLAGPYAEARASTQGGSVGAGGDLPGAREEAKVIAGTRWKDRIVLLSADSESLVNEHWRRIEMVARRLLKSPEAVRKDELLTLV